MKEITLPNYNEISLALEQSKLMLHPSEVHGLIAGTLCGDMKGEKSNWKQLIFENKETENTSPVLQHLYDVSQKKLAEFLFEFELVLPSDSQSLSARAEALTLWCQGFLMGLKAAHVHVAQHKTGEIADALKDIVEIAKMNYDDVVDSEEDEAAYTELVEYVRMAVILIYQTLNEKHSTKANQSIH